ncbi:MAG: glycosyltransferase, partial [bacterium]|nr:glycosyltransferase [bacterium]
MKISIGSKVRSDPTISIIIPNYNTADYISETLCSVFSQTFTDFEVIVLNDGSPDSAELYPVLEPFRDRIIFIDKPTNDGT